MICDSGLVPGWQDGPPVGGNDTQPKYHPHTHTTINSPRQRNADNTTGDATRQRPGEGSVPSLRQWKGGVIDRAQEGTSRTVMQRRSVPETPVPLDHTDPFTLLIAVLLVPSADKKVNEVTPALFAAGPTPAAMAELDEEQILGFIRQLGLAKTKAKNVRRLAQLLLERHDGAVPQSFEELEALPGVGHKTASVVMAQAFGVPAFPVDTHIHRLAQRWGLSNGENVAAPNGISRRCFRKRPGTDSPPDHFLRSRVLHSARLRRTGLPPLQGALPRPPQAGDHAQGLISSGRFSVGLDAAVRRWVADAEQGETLTDLIVIQEALVGLINGAADQFSSAGGTGSSPT